MKMIDQFCLVVTWLIISMVQIFAISGEGITSQQIAYLKDFGYFEDQNRYSGALQTQESLKNSIKAFQAFARLPVTGVLDKGTKEKFDQPRCGMKDKLSNGIGTRGKRYVHQGSVWHKKDLTFQIENWSKDLSKADILKTIRNALGRWERASQIRFFYKQTGNADIKIRFTRGRHNDQYAFDGPGGTLAHAFYPGKHPISGDTHFDDDETFTLRSKKGKNFYWIALHEFGHALGMEHSNADGAIMYPWYESYKGYDVDLSDDDKRGIQALYGSPFNIRPPTPTRKTESDKNKCLDRVKAIFRNRFGETVVINLDKVYIYDRNLKKKKGPVFLNEYFKGLSSVDAVYILPNKLTVFFHEDDFSEYVAKRRRRNDRNAQKFYANGIFNIDAAFYWSKARKVYIFKGDVYWRYNPYNRRMDPGYPKKIRDGWKGVPDDIDAVYEWNNKVFFFKDEQYYRFDENRYEVLKNYPRPITSFLICNSNNNAPQRGKIVSSRREQEDRKSTSDKSHSVTWLFVTCNMIVAWAHFF